MQDIIMTLAKNLGVREKQVEDTIALLDEGNTVPFIARYRKEVTGGLDDAQLRELLDQLTYLRNMKARREEITRLIDEQGKLNQELVDRINGAATMTELEDIYRPYRPKRRTRATIAREKGLEPLADLLLVQELMEGDILEISASYIDPEKEVTTAEEALAGAKDIVAEVFSDDADLRKAIREYTVDRGILEVRGDPEAQSVYEM